MRQPITIEMPFPPSVNNLFAGIARRYPTAKYKRWRRAAELSILAARAPKLKGRVKVNITLHPADKRHRDSDNFGKATLDCLVRMQVIPDDHDGHVRETTIAWGEHRKQAAAVVTITPLS